MLDFPSIRKFSNAHLIPVKMGEHAQTFKMHTDVHVCLALRVTIVSIISTTAITLLAPRTPIVWMELTNTFADVALDFQASVKYYALSMCCYIYCPADSKINFNYSCDFIRCKVIKLNTIIVQNNYICNNLHK